MITTLGIIGTGHLAGFVMEGLRADGWPGRVVVHSRTRSTAEAFCQKYGSESGAEVAESAQAVVDRSDAVLLAVRPPQTEVALAGLTWPEGKLLISAIAGVRKAALETFAPGATVVRTLPLLAASFRASPTICYPNDPVVVAFLNRFGTALPLPDEDQFEGASTNGAVFGWYFAIMEAVVSANEAAGLSPEDAKSVGLHTMQAAVTTALNRPESPRALLDELATEGTITLQGAEILDAQNAITPWTEAFEAVVARLTKA